MDICEIKRSCFSNSSVSSRCKDNSLDLKDTKNYKPSTAKKFKESCSVPAGDAIAPALIAAPTYSTDSKLPSKKNNETKADHYYKAKEEQERNDLHTHIYIEDLDDSYAGSERMIW